MELAQWQQQKQRELGRVDQQIGGLLRSLSEAERQLDGLQARLIVAEDGLREAKSTSEADRKRIRDLEDRGKQDEENADPGSVPAVGGSGGAGDA